MIWGFIIAAISIVGSAYYQKKAMEDAMDSTKGILLNKSGASEGLRIIYGTRRVGAIKVWKGVSRNGGQMTTAATSGYDKVVRMGSGYFDGLRHSIDYLHRLDVWGQGPIESIESFTIDGDPHTASRWQDAKNHPYYSSISFYGSSSQSLPSELIAAHPEVTSSMKGNDVAYTWNRFLYGTEAPEYQGEPQCVATVKGLKVWDPRTNPTNATIKAWSNNPALVLLDYLMADYGKGLSESDLHIQSFIDAANACDTTVATTNVAYHSGAAQYYYDYVLGTYVLIQDGEAIPSYRNWVSNTTTSQKRFQCDIVLEPKNTTQENVNKILKTMKGSLPYSQGEYKLVLEDTATSVKSFDYNNILGKLDISFADRSKRLNRVTIKFPNRNKDFEDDLVSYPELDSLQYSNYYAEDQSEDLHNEIKLEGVTDYYQALDLAEFIVKDSRTQMFVSFKAQPEAMTLEAGDIISLTHETPGWTNKEFRVRELTINSDLTVNIKAQDYDSSIYNWGTKDPEPTVAWEFINPFSQPDAITGLTLTQVNEAKNDGTVQTNLQVGWDTIVNEGSSIDRAFIGYRAHTAVVDAPYETWATIPSTDTSYTIRGLDDTQQYDVAVFYKDITGFESVYTESSITLVAPTTVIDSLTTDVSTAEANATAAASAAAQAATDAATAQAAADAAQATADAAGDSQAVQDAQAAADAAQAAADAAQATADAAQTSAEVLAAIAADTTAIDGSRITTGTIDLNRLTAVPLTADDVSSTGTTVIDGGRITTNTLDGNSITATSDVIVGTGAETAALSGDVNDDYRIWSGGATGDVANFSVDKDGQVIANAITISDENGSVMFNSQSGFTQAAKSQILEDTIETTSVFSFDQPNNLSTVRTITLLEAKAVTISSTFSIRGSHATASTATAARALQPSSVSQQINVNGSSIGSSTFTAVYNNSSPSASQFNIRDAVIRRTGENYAALSLQSKTTVFTTTLAAGTHTIQSVVSQDVDTLIEDNAVSVQIAIDDGGSVISTGSSTVTISNTAPTSVGSTSHGHLFYTY